MNFSNVSQAADFLNSKGFNQCENAIILGTGLGSLVKDVQIKASVSYASIPHFPESTVETHSGNLILGNIAGTDLIICQGRFHFYEGYSMEQVVFPVRVMKLLGVKNVLVSNAAGSINQNFKKGSLMLIKDHINLFPEHPLIGPNNERLGVRFPDMSSAYSKDFNKLILSACRKLNIQINEGVYASAQGPMLETPSEYRMLQKFGADAVGMSTIPEIIAANHAGIQCCAISVLTDECNPNNLKPINIQEIISIALKAEQKLVQLVKYFFNSIA